MRPEVNEQSRICLNFGVDGLNVYANRQALIDLRDQLTWLVDSPPEEHYHLHVLMTLENDQSKFDGKRPRNAGVVISDHFNEIARADIEQGDVVDLSFFMVPERDLDEMQAQQR